MKILDQKNYLKTNLGFWDPHKTLWVLCWWYKPGLDWKYGKEDKMNESRIFCKAHGNLLTMVIAVTT